MVLIGVAKLMIGRLQEGSLCESEPGFSSEIDVRGIVTSGSANNTAVASTVLGIKNPDDASAVE